MVHLISQAVQASAMVLDDVIEFAVEHVQASDDSRAQIAALTITGAASQGTNKGQADFRMAWDGGSNWRAVSTFDTTSKAARGKKMRVYTPFSLLQPQNVTIVADNVSAAAKVREHAVLSLNSESHDGRRCRS